MGLVGGTRRPAVGSGLSADVQVQRHLPLALWDARKAPAPDHPIWMTGEHLHELGMHALASNTVCRPFSIGHQLRCSCRVRTSQPSRSRCQKAPFACRPDGDRGGSCSYCRPPDYSPRSVKDDKGRVTRVVEALAHRPAIADAPCPSSAFRTESASPRLNQRTRRRDRRAIATYPPNRG